MARHRYDYGWKEVQDINGYVVLLVYVVFAIRGLGFLVVTWTTVVLLGGFVSMIDKHDVGRLTLITLVQILWINASFTERMMMSHSVMDSSSKTVKNLLMHKWQIADKACGDPPKLALVKRVVGAVRAAVGWFLAEVHNKLLVLCRLIVLSLFAFGLLITTSYSIYGLVKHDYYGETDEGRTNIYQAHTILYVLCVAQGALFLYRLVLARWEKRIVEQVSQAYGFQDSDGTISGYLIEIKRRCFKKPSSTEETNLITYAIALMESKSPRNYLSGTRILDRLLTRQHSDKIKAPTLIEQEEKQQHQLDFKDKTGAHFIKKRKKKHHKTEEEIIVQQRRVIKRLIGSTSSTDVLQKLLDTLDSKRSYDKRMREAAARIVEHVASRIPLDRFPRGIQCIASLINSFEEYRRLRPHQLSSSLSTNDTTPTSPPSSDTKNGHDQEQGSDNISSSESESESDSDNDVYQSSSKALHGYKDLVLSGLHIIWSLAGSEENCVIIINTKHLVSKILAPVSCDLLHLAGHSSWSTSVVERTLGVMLRLIVTSKGDTRADLRQQISSDRGAITTMKKIATYDGCKGGELQMKAMQILTQLCMDETTNINNLTETLVSIFVNSDNSDGSIRKTAGKTLVVLFLRTKSVTSLLPKVENDKFVGDLAKMLLQVGDNDTCKSAAEIMEHLCIQYMENEQYLSTLKDIMTGLIPKVLRGILSWLTGEKGKPRYARSVTGVENQVTTNNGENNNCTSSYPRQNKQHKLHVALLSLCATACDKLHLDLDTISLRGQANVGGDCLVFSLAIKMVQLNRDLITANNLKAMKLITRMVIAAMKKLRDHNTVVERADLGSLMDSLTTISESMLDLEGSMVFGAGMTTSVPASADTLDSLVKQALQLHSEIKNQESEINVR
ncbi:unnamed protein product [Alopecurus aequalis]